MEKVVNSEWAASELNRLRQENDALRQELANLKGKSSVWQEELQRLHAENKELRAELQKKTQFILKDQQERNKAEYDEAIRRAAFAKRGPKTNVNLHKDILFRRDQGMSIRKIAKLLGCSPSTVQLVLKKRDDN